MHLRLATAVIPLAVLAGSSPAHELVYSERVQDAVASGRVSYFLEGKRGEGHDEACEDGIFYSDHYLAVVDGATDKSGHVYQDGRKGGRAARDIVLEVFAGLEPGLGKAAVLGRINRAMRAFHARHPDLDFAGEPSLRPTASLIWYSFERRELAAVGDCKARVDGRRWNEEEKLVDRVNADLRCRIIRELGLTAEQVLERDLGREYIMPLLRAQGSFQNNPEAPAALRYWVVDGFDVPEEAIRSWRLERPPRRIELSSDGYPDFPRRASVENYERLLTSHLETNPARIGRHRSTKGLRRGNVSFDDRAVLIWRGGR